jgi:hypothetical protein
MLTTDDVKQRRWNIHDLVLWLLDCDIHIILCQHYFGAMFYGYWWDIMDIYTEMDYLTEHLGFPTGGQLRCPVFTVNKYEYIAAVPEFTIPTLKIEIIEYNRLELLSRVSS